MIELGISRARPATEVRSGEHSYTDLVLAGLLAQQGRGAASAEWATGAVQSAAGLWARCLSVATSDLEPVTPEVLGAIGFDLAVVGEHVSVLQVDAGGRVALLRASSWNIAGGPDPASWLYDVSAERADRDAHAGGPGRWRVARALPARQPDPLARRGSVEARAVTEQAHSGSRGGADS